MPIAKQFYLYFLVSIPPFCIPSQHMGKGLLTANNRLWCDWESERNRKSVTSSNKRTQEYNACTNKSTNQLPKYNESINQPAYRNPDQPRKSTIFKPTHLQTNVPDFLNKFLYKILQVNHRIFFSTYRRFKSIV